MMLRKRYNIGSFLDVGESWLRASGFSYRREINDNKHRYVAQHDMGSN